MKQNLRSLRRTLKSREDSLISYLRKLKDKIIDDAIFHKILPCGSTPGVLYSLPKVQKLGCPFRPIVSSINTDNYNLASYLVRKLQPISTNEFTIKDSFSFADWAKTYNHNNEMMCSFDVSSLFTNVPLDETIQICLDKLYAPPTLPRSVSKVLLEFATKKSHFIFDGQYYDQIDGVAMGHSPLGPVSWPISLCAILKKNGFVITTLALPFGFDTLTILSPCTTVKTQQLSFYTTSITVTQILNSPLNLKITVQSLSWTFSSNATVILSQHLFTERRPLLACTQNEIVDLR